MRKERDFMRLINSVKNMTSAFFQMMISTLLGFCVRSVFIATLGLEYQGLNGLFSSILFMLSIAELGIGTAIIFNLYPLISQQETEKIKTLMHFYKICYRIVASVVSFIGLALLPFLKIMINFHGISENINLLYLLYLSSTVATYLLSYKRSMLYADQKNYVLNITDTMTSILMNIIFLFVLIKFRSYVVYLVVTLVFTILENLFISVYVDNKYPYLKEKKIEKLEAKVFSNFKLQIYGMFFHNVGNFAVFGTDNLIISKFLGLKVMGLYSNYLLVITSISTLLTAIITSLTASVGNLLTEKKTAKSFEIYQNISFINFWIYSFASISIFLLMQPFVILWLGKNELLSESILLVITINFYVQGQRKPIQLFQNASGIFYENRHIPVFESVINLISSILLVNYLGLSGVLLGTLLSTMVLYSYSFPKYIYQPVFHQKIKAYLIEQAGYLMLFLITLAMSWIVSACITRFNNTWIIFILNAILALFLPNLFFLFVFRKRSEFKYFENLLRDIFKGNLK